MGRADDRRRVAHRYGSNRLHDRTRAAPRDVILPAPARSRRDDARRADVNNAGQRDHRCGKVLRHALVGVEAPMP